MLPIANEVFVGFKYNETGPEPPFAASVGLGAAIANKAPPKNDGTKSKRKALRRGLISFYFNTLMTAYISMMKAKIEITMAAIDHSSATQS